MNYCKLASRLKIHPIMTNNVRKISAMSITLDSPKYKNQSIHRPYTNSLVWTGKRQFSFEGIAEWQNQTYLSISNSYMVQTMQDGLVFFHDTTGMTWWATIVTSTVLVRALITLPLTVYQNYILAKVENISLELQDMVNELKKETAMAKAVYKLNDKQAVNLYKISLKKQWVKLIERDNCHPLKASFVMWIQIPMWVCISFAIRNLVYMQPPDAYSLVRFMELSAGGIGWIPNLTEPDHSLILPVAFGLLNLSVIEIQRMSKLRKQSKLYNIFTNVFRVFSIVMIPVAAYVPSSMCLYWCTSSAFGLLQNLWLVSPTVRRRLRIPVAPSELEHPYSYMKEEMTQKLAKTPIVASIYTSGRDEKNFSRANEFLPYRWDRNDSRKKDLNVHVSSASIPFALGARSCIGRKLAMIQLSELVSQIADKFDMICLNNNEIQAVTSQVLVPSEPIKIMLTPKSY